MENAIIESRSELKSLYSNGIMLLELEQMIRKLLIHIPPENIFSDFASRTDVEIVKNFSQILSIAKQTGGDLIFIILKTTSSISAEIDIRQEINTSLAGKKYELYIMAVMPVIIMFYIKITQPNFFSVMYHNIIGITVMTLCLVAYIAALMLANKILSITT